MSPENLLKIAQKFNNQQANPNKDYYRKTHEELEPFLNQIIDMLNTLNNIKSNNKFPDLGEKYEKVHGKSEYIAVKQTNEVSRELRAVYFNLVQLCDIFVRGDY